jgi:hypothetical protein
VNQLSLLTGSTNNAHDRVVGKPTRSANPPQTAPLAMSLKHLSDLLWRNLAMIVQGIKPFLKRLLALGTKIPLASVGCFTVFMNVGITTQPTFHRSFLGVDVSLLYLTHLDLMHYPTNQCAKRVKELEVQIQALNALKEPSASTKQQVATLKQEQKQSQSEERSQQEQAKQEQAKGDSLYWYIYNLDQKNPNAQTDFEHLPPEQLVADIWQKEHRILEILGEIKDVLKTKASEVEVKEVTNDGTQFILEKQR